MMNTPEYFREHFERLQSRNGDDSLGGLRREAYHNFRNMGIPTVKHEEWKYTRISSLFNREYELPLSTKAPGFSAADLDAMRLPAHEEANELVFINGVFSQALSVLRSEGLELMTLEQAKTSGYEVILSEHLGHSNKYQRDGILALNTAFFQGGAFVHVKNGLVIQHPVYIYNITDARVANVLAQPRSLVYVGKNAELLITETYVTIGSNDSFTNQVMEIVVEKDARVQYYKIQNDNASASQVSTTHFRQIGKSHVHAVTVSLNGNIVRNNLNAVLEAEHSEAHLYGLYYLKGQGHIDNHTIVDNVKPNCYSNELYKGILDSSSTGVFNGKIFVQPLAQKTNAYQSNKNILLSDKASVNTKPQLEIFADDVKCSHGCTVGRLNEEGLFYLLSRGISEKTARVLLLRAYAADILEHIKPEPIRKYIDGLITAKLESEIS